MKLKKKIDKLKKKKVSKKLLRQSAKEMEQGTTIGQLTILPRREVPDIKPTRKVQNVSRKKI